MRSSAKKRLTLPAVLLATLLLLGGTLAPLATGVTRAALCAAVGALLAVHRSNLSRAWQFACTLPITPHAGAGAAPLPALQTRVYNGSLAGGTMLARVYAQLPEKKPCGNHGFPGQDCTPHYSTSEYGSSEQSHAAWTHGLLSCSCLVRLEPRPYPSPPTHSREVPEPLRLRARMQRRRLLRPIVLPRRQGRGQCEPWRMHTAVPEHRDGTSHAVRHSQRLCERRDPGPPAAA